MSKAQKQKRNEAKRIAHRKKIADAEKTKSMVEISKLVTEGQVKAEIECLTKVLKQLLNREPTNEDFSKCIKIEREGIINSYVLAYEDMKLGLITREFMCDANIINEETGFPDFKFNCKFDPDTLEVPLTEESIFDAKNLRNIKAPMKKV